MTPKEAIETIKMAISAVEWDYPMDYAAAFDMAIEALELVTINTESDEIKVTNCNDKDTIYRQAAIDEIDKMFEHEVNSEIDAVWNQAVEMASNKIKYDLPPAQPDWGKPVGYGRPLADSEVIPRLRDIQKQIGGSYAIDRAIEVLEGLQEAQPKIILCKDCKHRYEDECPMRHVEWVEYEDDGYIDMDDVIYDYTEDDGYCFKAEG